MGLKSSEPVPDVDAQDGAVEEVCFQLPNVLLDVLEEKAVFIVVDGLNHVRLWLLVGDNLSVLPECPGGCWQWASLIFAKG